MKLAAPLQYNGVLPDSTPNASGSDLRYRYQFYYFQISCYIMLMLVGFQAPLQGGFTQWRRQTPLRVKFMVAAGA